MKISGKVVLITGASEGIGAACAEAFKRRGAKLSLVARSAEKLERVGGDAAVRTAGDLRDAEVRRSAVEATIERFGGVDILINSAGQGQYAPSWRAPLEDVRAMFELNVFVLLGMIQLVVPHMRRQGRGVIVNLSSIAGRVTLPWMTMYSASKYSVCSLTDGLRMELEHDGIHAITVCPGYVKTAFQEHVLSGKPPGRIRKIKKFAITAEECAEAIARGVERDARTVLTPRVGWFLVVLERLFPSLTDRRLAGIYHNLEKAP